MATLNQIEANRLNAQKSTGPRSVEGKAVSSQNALKTGIDAESLIIRGEDGDDLETLTAEYVARFCPQTPEQRHYVDSLIRDDWQLRRLAKADAQIWEYAMSSAFKLDQNAPLGHAFQRADKSFIRLQRRIDSTHRSYKAALHELQRLQAEQPAAQALEAGGADPQVCARSARVPPGPALEQPVENTPLSHQIGFAPSLCPDNFQAAEPIPDPQSPIPPPAPDSRPLAP
jgi:hypothetical protein